jgi:glyoxylase-like metal-dependent hydrolase (beta-lactamase superfamily II)
MKYKIVPVTPYQQNCSVIWCEETLQAAVVDPGGDLDHILRTVSQFGMSLQKILLTHGHLDHVGATAALSKQYDLPIEGPHKGDLFWLEGLEEQAKMMGFGGVEHFTPDRWLVEGDSVTVGKCELQVLHCPGHTPGHVVFYESKTKQAFVGDVLFNGSVGRSDFPQGNHEQLVASIREKLFPLGDDVRFVPGHGPESSFGFERKNNPFVADHRFG